ncbi:MAG TPA: NAD(P)H-dependent oxidoreductase [Candidatus Dorea merdavium]|nr:NAD(P)H-dependent oxidoreductase [Candidatus Dorea merdavium]
MKSKLLKKMFSIMLVGTVVCSLAACSGGTGEEEQPETQETAENVDIAAGEGTALIAYFSWSGNTEAVAQEIQAQTGADLFEIVPAEPYTDDYDELLDIAQEEQSSDARPAIAETVDLSSYDTVYLGFPNWWGDMPMILYTFLDEYDLSGKTIAPFNTSGGSGFSGSLDTIAQMEPEAEITEGISLGSEEAEDCADEVAEWLANMGMTEEADS